MSTSAIGPLNPPTRMPEHLLHRHRSEGDLAAREELVVRFLPLARELARRYFRSSVPPEDLVQVASLALVKAVDRFDPQRGTPFRAFAIPTILGELKRYFRDSAWDVHVPRSTQERALAVGEATEQLTGRSGRPPTVHEIAGYLELSQEQVLDALQAAQAYASTSLDAPPPPSAEASNELTLESELGVEDERFELIEAKLAVAEAARSLPETERQILYLWFIEELTQSEIGARLGTSQMHVSRALRRSLAHLRTLAGSDA
jgi:RNA polymerase sigma-B factor